MEIRDGPLVSLDITLLIDFTTKFKAYQGLKMLLGQMKKCHMQILSVTRDIQMHKE